MKTGKVESDNRLRVTKSDAVLCSSRVRLARNLEGISFPGWSEPAERTAVWERVTEVVRMLSRFHDPTVQTICELDPLQRLILQERQLISTELVSGDAACGVIYEGSERLSIMVNEEDHLRIQSVAPGFALLDAWKAAHDLHTALEGELRFAFSPRYGYLTACPSNVGTGIRASVMVHLVALRLMGEFDAVVRGLERTGFAVRGVSGEGSYAYGGFCQISNQKTLGIDEAGTLRDVEDMVESVLRIERDARVRLLQMRPWVLEDHVSRAYGLLRHAKLLTTGEAFENLSAVLLGLDQGLIRGVDTASLRQLLREVQPGHLQFQEGRTLAVVDRDRYRARHIWQALATMELV